MRAGEDGRHHGGPAKAHLSGRRVVRAAPSGAQDRQRAPAPSRHTGEQAVRTRDLVPLGPRPDQALQRTVGDHLRQAGRHEAVSVGKGRCREECMAGQTFAAARRHPTAAQAPGTHARESARVRRRAPWCGAAPCASAGRCTACAWAGSRQAAFRSRCGTLAQHHAAACCAAGGATGWLAGCCCCCCCCCCRRRPAAAATEPAAHRSFWRHSSNHISSVARS